MTEIYSYKLYRFFVINSNFAASNECKNNSLLDKDMKRTLSLLTILPIGVSLWAKKTSNPDIDGTIVDAQGQSVRSNKKLFARLIKLRKSRSSRSTR